MEKIEWLIDKLKRQSESGAGAAAMLATLQLLQTELSGQLTDASGGSKAISVLLPQPRWSNNTSDELNVYEAEHLRSADEEKVVFELDPVVYEKEETETLQTMAAKAPPEIHSSYLPEKKHITEPILEAQSVNPHIIVTAPLPKDLPAEILPPISQSLQAPEMKSPAIPTDQRSLNDLLEKPADELFTRLHEPIRDLKKAISINDRYQYIHNLFRGDEAMYDRSIKTINNFNIYSEADYWIRRELAAKHVWAEKDALVQQFYALVRRRFS